MRIFISYSTHDTDKAEQLNKALTALQQTPWFAPSSMKMGSFSKQLASEIVNCDIFVVLVSGQAASSSWVEREFHHAQALNKPIVPVIIAPPPVSSGLALNIANLNHIDLSTYSIEQCAAEISKQGLNVHRGGRVLVSFNMKGGVGKTVLAGNIGAAFALEGKVPNVLMIDCDPQFNLSQMFLDDDTIAGVQDKGLSLLAVLEGAGCAESSGLEFARPLGAQTPGTQFQQRIDLIVGHDGLFDFAINNRKQDEFDTAKQKIIELIARARAVYDLIILDVNPSAAFPTTRIVQIADHFMIPVRPERFALRGVGLLKKFVEGRRAHRELSAEEFSIVINEVAAPSNMTKRETVRNDTIQGVLQDPAFADSLVPGYVPFSSALQSPPVDEPFAEPIRDATAFGRNVGGTNLRTVLRVIAKVIGERARITAQWPS